MDTRKSYNIASHHQELLIHITKPCQELKNSTKLSAQTELSSRIRVLDVTFGYLDLLAVADMSFCAILLRV